MPQIGKALILGLVLTLSNPANSFLDEREEIRARIEKSTKTYLSELEALTAAKKEYAPFSDQVLLAYTGAIGTCYVIALAHEELKEYTLALQWYEKAVGHAEECNEPLVSSRYLSTFTGYFRQAKMNLILGRYSNAQEMSSRAITKVQERDLNVGEAYMILGQSSLILGEFDESKDALETAKTNFQGSSSTNKFNLANTFRVLASLEYLKGNLSAAREQWNIAATTDGRFADIDPFDPNQVTFNEAVFKNSKDVNARISRAEFLLDRGRQLANDTTDPGAAPLHQGGVTNLALIKSPEAESFEESAIIDLNQALRTDQKNSAALILRAQAKKMFNARNSSHGKYPETSIADDIIWAKLYENGNPKSLFALANFYLINEYPVRSTLRFLSQGILVSKDLQLNQRAAVLQKQIVDSLESPTYNGSKVSKPKTLSGWNDLAMAHSQAGDWRGALKCYDEAIKLDAKNAEIYVNRGRLFESLGCIDLAMSDYSKSTEVDPKNGLGFFYRAIQLANLRIFSDAQAEIEKALQLKPNPDLKGRCLALRCQIYLEQFNASEALRDAREAVLLAPTNQAIRQRLATALLLSGKPVDAAKELTGQNQSIRARLLKSLALNLSNSQEFEKEWQETLTQVTREELTWLEKFLVDWAESTSAPSANSPESDRFSKFYTMVKAERSKKPA